MTVLEEPTYSALATVRRLLKARYRLGILVVGVFAAVPLVDDSGFLLSIGTHTLINAVLALSLTLVYGMGGMISLAQVGFGAVAAYIVIIGQREGLSFVPAVIAAIAVVIVLSLLLGLPVVHMSGVYLLTATFAFTEILRLIALNWTSITGGQIGPIVQYNGLTRLPGASLLAGFMPAYTADYAVGLLLFLVTAMVVWCYRQSRSGRNLMSLRDNEAMAGALGIRAVRERLLALALSAVIAACGGIYLAYYNGIIGPTAMDITRSVDLLVIVIVGGIYSIRGALVGAIVVTVVPELLQISVSYRPILYGLLLIIFATRLRLGIVGELQRLVQTRRSRRERSPSFNRNQLEGDAA